MQFGISTACFYPEHTEQAAQRLAREQLPVTEIFLNSFQELNPGFARELRRTLGNTRAVSVHPCSSGMETMLFFTAYDRRFDDGLELYRRYFSFCGDLGARYLIFHGVHNNAPIEPEQSFERYARLADEAEKAGVELLQENVSRCFSGQPDYIRAMRRALGSRVEFALDTKQCIRAGTNAFEMLEAMGDAVRHLHVSDSAPGKDCLPPGAGTFDFAAFYARLRRLGFDGTSVIELYRQNYDQPRELYEAYKKLAGITEGEK